MSFFGKKYKKVDANNIIELLDALKVSEKVREVLRKPNSVTYFEKNADGSISYITESNGDKILNQKIILDAEHEFTTPDGIVTKNAFKLNGDVLSGTMSFPDGHVISFDRKFDGNKMTMTIKSTKTDISADIFYETV